MTDLPAITVTAHTAALTDYARAEHTAADAVAAHATRQRAPVAQLTMTFGVIGADFLAAMGYTLDRRAQNLDAIAARHRSSATGTENAERTYRGTDVANAMALRGTATRAFSGDQELRL